MPKDNNRTHVGDRVSIYPRGKKKIYCADFWFDGKHHRKTLETRNKKIAIQRAVKIDAGLTSGSYSAPPRSTKISEAVEKFISYHESEGRADKTIGRYSGELNSFCEICAALGVHNLSQVTMLVFDKYRADRSKIHEDPTVFHESLVVKQFVKWCKQRKLLLTNPLEEYRLKKPKHKPKGGPALEQVEQVLKMACEPRYSQFAMLAFTGMRSGELRHLLPSDVDLDGGWIHIVSRPGAETKTGESRKVPIHARLRTLLEALPRSNRKWFFTAPPSKRYPSGGHWVNTKTLNEDFIDILKELGIPAGRKNGFTLHSLRHFFKTYCINDGIPKPVVDTWQGHKIDMSVGAQYYKLADADSLGFMKKVSFDTGESAADADNP